MPHGPSSAVSKRKFTCVWEHYVQLRLHVVRQGVGLNVSLARANSSGPASRSITEPAITLAPATLTLCAMDVASAGAAAGRRSPESHQQHVHFGDHQVRGQEAAPHGEHRPVGLPRITVARFAFREDGQPTRCVEEDPATHESAPRSRARSSGSRGATRPRGISQTRPPVGRVPHAPRP